MSLLLLVNTLLPSITCYSDKGQYYNEKKIVADALNGSTDNWNMQEGLGTTQVKEIIKPILEHSVRKCEAF